MMAPSGNWNVRPDPQSARSNAIRDSVARSAAQAAFEAEEQAVFGLLGWTADEDDEFVRPETCETFAVLLALPNEDVMRVAAFAMARSVQAGSEVVEEVGQRLNVDARAHWQPDDTFFDLIRDRATLNALLGELAGEAVAQANLAEKAKTQKQIVRDCLAGANGRTKIENWLPGWMAFPARGIGEGGSADTDTVPLAAE